MTGVPMRWLVLSGAMTPFYTLFVCDPGASYVYVLCTSIYVIDECSLTILKSPAFNENGNKQCRL